HLGLADWCRFLVPVEQWHSRPQLKEKDFVCFLFLIILFRSRSRRETNIVKSRGYIGSTCCSKERRTAWQLGPSRRQCDSRRQAGGLTEPAVFENPIVRLTWMLNGMLRMFCSSLHYQ